MSFLKNICGTLGTKAIFIFCGVISGMITARWLGPHDRGILAVATSLPATIWMLSSFGINQANVYYIAKKQLPLPQIVSNSFIVPLCSGSVICLLLWVTKNSIILKYVPTINSHYLALILALVPLMMIQNSYLGVLRGVEKFSLINTRQTARTIGGVIVTACILIGFHGTIISLVSSIIVIEFIFMAWILFEVNKISKIDFSFHKETATHIFRFGVKSYFQNIIGYLHNRIDIYMIAFFLKASDVAFYDIAVITGELLLFLPQSITFVILPKLVQLEKENKSTTSLQIGRITFLITVALGFILAISGNFLIRSIYGIDYADAYPALLCLLPGLVISCLNSVTISYFTSMHHQKIPIVLSLLCLAANIVTNYYLIPLYGIMGAAISSSITYSLYSVSLILAFKYENHTRLRDAFILKKDDILLIKKMLFNLRAPRHGC